MVAGIDANDAQVSKVADRDFILSRIERLAEGFETVNKLVKAALRDWLASSGRQTLERAEARAPDDEGAAVRALQAGLAYLLSKQGKYGEAEPLYRRALQGREAELGPSHPDTLSSVFNLFRFLLVDQALPLEAIAVKLQHTQLDAALMYSCCVGGCCCCFCPCWAWWRLRRHWGQKVPQAALSLLAPSSAPDETAQMQRL